MHYLGNKRKKRLINSRNYLKRKSKNKKDNLLKSVKRVRDGLKDHGKKELQTIRKICHLDDLRISRELSRISEYSY